MDALTPQQLAVVIGGSGAIGAAVVADLAERGYAVIATHNDQPDLPEAADVRWVKFDAESGHADELRDAVADDDRPLTAVAFVVGVPSSKRLVADTPIQEFARLNAVNALSLVLVWRAIADRARAGASAVAVVSSDTTRHAGAGNAAYTASKAALEAIALTMAKEEARHGVRVNVVAPSLIKSPQAEQILALKGITDPDTYYSTLPGGRALTTTEVGKVVTAVVSDLAWGYANGMVWRLATDANMPAGRQS